MVYTGNVLSVAKRKTGKNSCSSFNTASSLYFRLFIPKIRTNGFSMRVRFDESTRARKRKKKQRAMCLQCEDVWVCMYHIRIRERECVYKTHRADSPLYNCAKKVNRQQLFLISRVRR